MDNASLVPQPGHLYVVATPIGNLADLTERARAILGAVDLIACEDTRTTGAMLTRLGIRRELVAYHEHNEIEAAERLAGMLVEGKSIAVVTDAGTPGLSDPGFPPGAGLPQTRPARRAGARRRARSPPCSALPGCPRTDFSSRVSCRPNRPPGVAFLEKYRDFPYTLAFYESCHRIDKFVDEIVATLGPDARPLCRQGGHQVARDLPGRPGGGCPRPPRQDQPQGRVRRPHRPGGFSL